MAADNNLESRQSFRNTQNEGELDTLNLADIWAMIWNNKWWYVLSICICIFFAVFYIYRTSPTFSRTAKVIIDDSNENSALRDLASLREDSPECAQAVPMSITRWKHSLLLTSCAAS